MLFAVGFIFGIGFCCVLFMSGGDVFKQLYDTRIALDNMTKERDEWREDYCRLQDEKHFYSR
jgi:hypothetical protein